MPHSGKAFHTTKVPNTLNAGAPARDTILIVEDDFDIRDLLQQYLEVSGYAVQTATNGAEALAALRAGTEEIGLVLLDRNMENMDGKDFLDALFADAALAPRCPPVVMMSAAGGRKFFPLVFSEVTMLGAACHE